MTGPSSGADRARTARQEEARAAILAAAARAIASRGFHGMTMRELARATGRSLAGFYNYFPSKEELLFALQQEAFEALIAGAQAALDGVEGAKGRLYVFILHHVRAFAEHPAEMRVLIQEAAALPPERRRVVRELKRGYFRIGRALVTDVMGPDAPADAELERLTYSVFGMLNWIYGWYEIGRHGGPTELARTIYRLALAGLRGRRPGQEALDDLDRHLADVINLGAAELAGES